MLHLLGAQTELTWKIDSTSSETLKKFDRDWKPYNPRKAGYGREGLSLTSLDGQLTGTPDLDSLTEYNQIHKTNFSENSFKTRTQVVEAIPSLQEIFDSLGGSVSRSHIIRFKKGGFFPPHRDLFPTSKEQTFRLFSLLSHAHPSQYHFVLDGQLRYFMPRTLYYLNTMLEHSFVSFSDNLSILVLNIELNEQTIEQIQKRLVVR